MNKSMPMTLERAHALKIKMKDNPDLFAVNNLRVFQNHGAWRVDANVKSTGKIIRVHCENEYDEWLEYGYLPCLRCGGTGTGDGGGLLESESECGKCNGTGERS